MTDNLLRNFHFQVDWGGARLGFKEVSNLTVGIRVIEYRDGNSKEFHTQKIPGRPYYENIILRRGAVKADNEFFDWWERSQYHPAEKRDISIKLLDEEHNPSLVWQVRSAFAVKVTWADLKSTGNEVLIESLEIAHEGISVMDH